MTIAGIVPRAGSTLDHVQLWDTGCVTTRLNELKALFMTKLELEEQAQLRDQHFKKMLKEKKLLPIPQWQPLTGGEKEQRYGEKVRKLAEEVLEQERQNYVDYRAERDKNLIIEIIRELRRLVWVVNEEGEPEKVKITIETVTEPVAPKGDWVTHQIQYIGDRTSKRLDQINSLKARLRQLRTYVPYYSSEIRKLYEEAEAIGSLEYVHKEKKKEASQ